MMRLYQDEADGQERNCAKLAELRPGFICPESQSKFSLSDALILLFSVLALAAPILLSLMQLAEMVWPGVLAAVFGAGQ
jgi:hypothetical protein